MKNMKKLVLAVSALFAVGSMATVVQPAVPSTEDAPFRVSAGFQTGMVFNRAETLTGTEKGFGLENMGGSLSFSHLVGMDFEYGLGVAFGAKSYGKLFNKDSKEAKLDGMQLDVDLMLRYMPEIADGFNLGGMLNIGWGNFFYDKENTVFKSAAEQVAFGTLNVKVGPSMSYKFTDGFAMYFAPQFTIKNIQFMKGDAKMSPDYGVELPVGAVFGVTDSLGIFIEANNMFQKLNVGDNGNVMDKFKLDGTIGVNWNF